jgi:hypothetical protein
MRVNLADLLRTTELAHPSFIRRLEWQGDSLTVHVEGRAWWRGGAASGDGALRLVFGGLGLGALRTDEFDPEDDEALESLSITALSEVDWARPAEWSVYCRGPLPRPPDLYVRVHDFLAEREAIRRPGDFLNSAERISRFAAITQTAGYWLGSGPAWLRDMLCEELERQGVPYDVVHTAREPASGWLVRLGDSAFVCEEAYAGWEDRGGGVRPD